jgi:hypothetical protein
MPYTVSLRRSAKGREYVHALASGIIDGPMSNEFMGWFGQGGRYSGKALLSVMADDAKYTVESRKALTTLESQMPAIAAVVTSPAVRVMLNFMLKASAAAQALTGSSQPPPNLRTFNREEEALAWLDSEMERLAK